MPYVGMKPKHRLLTVLLLAAVLFAVLVSSAAAAPQLRLVNGTLQTSSNWAGYAVAGLDPTTTYTSVSGTWVQPAATCASTASSYAAFWVGLGGYSDTSQALEQIGTQVDCTSGKAAYSVWYELVPAGSVPVKLKLFPGNTVTASVTVTGSTVTVKLANVTRKTSFTKKLTMAAPDISSAEWVAEAPSACDAASRCQVLPLANFGTVQFARATATTTSGETGTISSPSWDATPIQLAADGGSRFSRFGPVSSAAAVPGALSADGSAFAVAWQASATA
jgi:hypothetical protein